MPVRRPTKHEEIIVAELLVSFTGVVVVSGSSLSLSSDSDSDSDCPV